MRPVPVVDGLPLVGALPSFFRDPLSTLRRTWERGDVARLDLGFIDAVTVHHPDHFDHVFRAHHRRYAKEGPFWSSVRSLLGEGLPVSTGEQWRSHRRLMQPQFHRRAIAGLTSLVVESLDDALRWYDVDRSWQVLDVGARIPHLAINVISASLFGLQTSRRRSVLIAREIDYAQKHMFWSMFTQQIPSWLPVPGRRRFARALDTVRKEVRSIIDQRRTAKDASLDVLGLLLAATDGETGKGLTDHELRDETMSLLVAGYETTATALQWALALLGQHPEIWGALREECDAVLGGRAPSVEDLPELRYPRWVMQEALRLYPPVWWLPRQATEDDEIGGHAIARGTVVAPVMYTMHRHPDFWVHPEQFEPERFAPEPMMRRHPLAWCPFGAGPRKCIGQELSLLESTLTLAMLSQRFELESAGHVPRPVVRTTLAPADGVRLRIRRRPTIRKPHRSTPNRSVNQQ